jgi:hypothetical protein
VFIEGFPFLESFSGLADNFDAAAGLFCSITVQRGIVPVTLGRDTLGAHVKLRVSVCRKPELIAFCSGGGRGSRNSPWRIG